MRKACHELIEDYFLINPSERKPLYFYTPITLNHLPLCYTWSPE